MPSVYPFSEFLANKGASVIVILLTTRSLPTIHRCRREEGRDEEGEKIQKKMFSA